MHGTGVGLYGTGGVLRNRYWVILDFVTGCMELVLGYMELVVCYGTGTGLYWIL